MEKNIIQKSTSIIETVVLNNINNEDITEEYILKDNQFLIPADSVNTTQYITCYENGQIILKHINTTDSEILKIESTEDPLSETIKNEPVIIEANEEILKQNRVFVKNIRPRKKLCYDKPYKPPAPLYKQGFRRKRLIIDYHTMIPPREFKLQLNNTTDTVTAAEFAPSTRQQIRHLLQGITRLFAHPSHKMPNSSLLQLFVSHCTCKKLPVEAFPYFKSAAYKKSYKRRRFPILVSKDKEKPAQVIQNKTENIDHRYSKQAEKTESTITDDNISKDENIDDNIVIDENIIKDENINDSIIKDESIDDSESVYTINLNQIKDDLEDDQIVILSVGDNGELTESNLNMLLEAANSQSEIQTSSEVVALSRNVEDYNNLNKIIVVRSDEANEKVDTILGLN